MFGARKIEEVRPDLANEHEQNYTVNDIIDAYMKDRRSEYSKRPCLHPESLEAHFKSIRAATIVYNELDGDLGAAAKHIADTPEMAERTYVQKDVRVKLPGLQAVAAVIGRARKRGA